MMMGLLVAVEKVTTLVLTGIGMTLLGFIVERKKTIFDSYKRTVFIKGFRLLWQNTLSVPFEDCLDVVAIMSVDQMERTSIPHRMFRLQLITKNGPLFLLNTNYPDLAELSEILLHIRNVLGLKKVDDVAEHNWKYAEEEGNELQKRLWETYINIHKKK